MVLDALRRPEYMFRPTQVFRRIRVEFFGPREGVASCHLPWGLEIAVQAEEVIGRALLARSVHELAASECLWRLLDDGENAFDVGANIGYMASLLAVRAGPSGSVMAFEPHPDLVQVLKKNVAGWQGKAIAPIRVVDVALSDRIGPANLTASEAFSSNNGIARLDSSNAAPLSWDVTCVTLDSFISDGWVVPPVIHVLKLDVEGHELNVLEGAKKNLSAKRFRDIVFEWHGPLSSSVKALLLGYGYEMFQIETTSFWGPRLHRLDTSYRPSRHFSPNYLATLDAGRALSRMSGFGWQILK